MGVTEEVVLAGRIAPLGVGLVLLALVAIGPVGAAGSASPTARCASDSTPAVVAGRNVCLREGATCRKRYQRQYRRHGFVCVSGSLWYDWKPLRRPLSIPTLTPGSACPATAPSGTLSERGGVDMSAIPAFGRGPALPAGLNAASGSAVLLLTWTPTHSVAYAGWWGTKVLWTIPRYYGAVLIRGGQLDGANALGFDLGPNFARRVLPELRLTGPMDDVRPAATFVRAPGCYAYQVDTFRSSYHIVFVARPWP